MKWKIEKYAKGVIYLSSASYEKYSVQEESPATYKIKKVYNYYIRL